MLIDRSIEKELRKHLVTPLTFRRLGINSDQIAFYDLPSKPRKLGDRRSMEVTHTVEAEAMPAATMRQILVEAVEAYLPENALRVAKVAEEEEISGLLQVAAIFRS